MALPLQPQPPQPPQLRLCLLLQLSEVYTLDGELEGTSWSESAFLGERDRCLLGSPPRARQRSCQPSTVDASIAADRAHTTSRRAFPPGIMA